MTYSMTAFARSDANGDWGSLQCEIRTVNHRYLEVTPRLPEDLRPLEPKIRERVTARLGRGKVDLGVRFRPAASRSAGAMGLNPELADQICKLSDQLANKLGGRGSVDLASLLQWPGLVEEAPLDMAPVFEQVMVSVESALDALLRARQREGDAMAAVIVERLDAIDGLVKTVKAHLPEIETAVRARLDKRLADLSVEFDTGRLEQELALQLQRLDVAEELDRLVTHVAEVRRVLGLDEPVGRRLDFLMQELNREANTLGSKAADTSVTNAAVDLKVLIEQMREQVQNIE
ncbi:MAG: hypothetical protein DHS20C11_23080 [Lysobacteraceae bacterium]|nr:MAG: hypothetical protein DHS20C11_23080 [Xanthomonadaceae bacterium]